MLDYNTILNNYLDYLNKFTNNTKLIHALYSNEPYFQKILEIYKELPFKETNTKNDIYNNYDLIYYLVEVNAELLDEIKKEKQLAKSNNKANKPIYITFLEILKKDYIYFNINDNEKLKILNKLIEYAYDNEKLMYFNQKNYKNIEEEIADYKKIIYTGKDNPKEKIGIIGELLFAKNNEKYIHVARLIGDGTGYDFLEKNNNNNNNIEKLHEVKTSLANKSLNEASIIISKNEIDTIYKAREKNTEYIIDKLYINIETKNFVHYKLSHSFNNNILIEQNDNKIVYELDKVDEKRQIFKRKLSDKEKERIKRIS